MKSNKINTLIKSEGCSTLDEFLEDYAFESVVPAICMNEGCDATYHYEPDQDRGHCEECGTKTVKSGLILLGVF